MSQSRQINVYLGEIANLKGRISRNVDLTAAQLKDHGVWAHGLCHTIG